MTAPPEPPAGPALMPRLMLSRGRVLRSGPSAPGPARGADGRPLDLFEVTERLGQEYGRMYVVDLDGVERDRPQLDFLQEIAKDAEVWVDGGVRSAEGAIDLLVTGAHRVVLSPRLLASPRELRRAWKMSSDLAVALEVRAGRALAGEAWGESDPRVLGQAIREAGPSELIADFEPAVDWELVRALAQAGPTWVGDALEASDRPRLVSAGAAGGIFSMDAWLDRWAAPS